MTRIDCEAAADDGLSPVDYIGDFIHREGVSILLEVDEERNDIIILDPSSAEFLGRKLLVTGNGRCNLTNVHVAPDRYTCADPAFLEGALGAFGREHLASYKVPRSISFTDEIPKTGTGKILKRVLREPYWKDHESRVL